MNLIEQTISNTNEVNVYDSLNSALMELKIKRNATTVVPNTNDLYVYVDKADSTNPTEDKKTYLFELIKPLDYFNGISDEFIMQLQVKNNKVKMETFVKRLVGETEENVKYLLDEPIYEELDYSQVILFSGVNYIYTNYEDADITLIYPKDNKENIISLNSSIYVNDNENHMEHTLEDIYFSNCFTKTEDKINIEVDNANIRCMTSKENNFSLDEEGNLIVKTITVADPISSTDLLSIYPVGSIYMSMNNTNPSTLFGGVWEQIKGRFLIGTGSNEANSNDYYGNLSANSYNINVGELGGERFHILTVNELPSHRHSVALYNKNWTSGVNGTMNAAAWGSWTANGGNNFRAAASDLTYTGNNQSHNNMPPYLAVYMWKRIQ